MQVRQARRRIERAGFCSSKAQQVGQPGPAIVRAGNGLAVICLSFGAAFAAFASSSLEQRIGNLIFLGFIPAGAVYAGGHLLGQLLVVSSKLCDVIMAGSFRYATLWLKELLSWVGTHVSNWLASLPAVRQKLCYSAHRRPGNRAGGTSVPWLGWSCRQRPLRPRSSDPAPSAQ
jgi:hypothetical protein